MARKSERHSGSDERGGRRWRLDAYTLFTFTLNGMKSDCWCLWFKGGSRLLWCTNP